MTRYLDGPAITSRFCRAAIKWAWGRSPFTLLQAPQSSCRLSKWPDPPWLFGMMWSTVKLRNGICGMDLISDTVTQY